MVRKDIPAPRVVRLKASSVMCEIASCGNEANFVGKQRNDPVRAVCEKHLRAMGLEIPLQAPE
jgi:hypothetical protein